MENPLVTLILPCYNAEKTLARFMRSLFFTSYRPMELVCIDDGSTDATPALLRHYQKIAEEQGIACQIFTQPNAGLGSAIQTGLLHMHGAFFCWADPDDILLPGSVEKRAAYLIRHQNLGAVSSDAYVFDGNDLPLYREGARFSHRFEPNQFSRLLCGDGMVCAGCHIIRTRCFDETVPEREIYPARRGQNYQLLLPVCYRFPHAFLDEPLYGYVQHAGSMSDGDTTEPAQLRRILEHETILTETVQRIDMPESERRMYLAAIQKRYDTARFYTAVDFRDTALLKKQYRILSERNALNKTLSRAYRRNRSAFHKLFFKLYEEGICHVQNFCNHTGL